MYLTDYHTHTLCSPDSQTPLEDQAEQAVRLGLRELCTTDHCDLIQEDGQTIHQLDWTPILEQYDRVRAAYQGRLNVKLGLELGGAPTDPEAAGAILSASPVDFVIGSIHNLDLSAGGLDFYYVSYRTREDCFRALDNYISSLAKLALMPEHYDVLGHIIYPLRYMTGVPGGPVTLEKYQQQLRDIFTAAVSAGRGIELNTYRGRTLEPWRPILELYRSCGGEIVTLGSDSHTAQEVGAGIQEGQELLKAAGFRYQAVYQRRTPQFIKL